MELKLIHGQLQAQLAEFEQIENSVQARGVAQDVRPILEKAAAIVAALVELFKDLPREKFSVWYVLTHAGRIADAVLTILRILGALAADAVRISAEEFNAAVAALENEKAQLSAVPDNVLKWMDKIVRVALLLRDFIASTTWGKIDVFFVLLNAGKIAKLITDVVNVVREA